MTYTINISLSNDTLQFLSNGFWLRIYKGETTSAASINTVWYTTNNFEAVVTIQWTGSYGGFIANYTPFNKGTVLKGNPVIPMQENSLLTINQAGIVSPSNTGGNPSALTFYNNSSNLHTCGVAQVVNSTWQTFSAMQLGGFGTDILAPKDANRHELVLLVFEASLENAGTIITETLNSSLMLAISDIVPTVNVSYDYQTSWNAKGNVNATIFRGPVVINDKMRSQYLSLKK